MGGEITMLPDDLPEDMPSFVARFGTDAQCREYLFKARWPDGFRCAACGHDDAYTLKTKTVYECVACRKPLCCTDRSGWRRGAGRGRGAAPPTIPGCPLCRSRPTPPAATASPGSGTGSPTGPSTTRPCASGEA